MNQCPSCGAKVPAGVRFCPDCGYPLQATARRPAGTGNAVQYEKENRIDRLYLDMLWVLVFLTIISVIASFIKLKVREANTPWPNAEYPAFYSQNGVGSTVGSFSENTEAIRTASRSVVRLDTYDEAGEAAGFGSAFAALEDGLFVTNWHVIEGAVEFRGQREFGEAFDLSEIVAYDAEKDLAILRASTPTGISTLPLGKSRTLEKGAKVLTLGSPQGLTNIVTSGLYSGTFYFGDEGRRYLLHTAVTTNGSSGSPLFNDVGEVVGVHRSRYEKDQDQILSCAIPIEYVVELYQSTLAPAD